MAKQNINVGTAANDKKGDSLRAAFQKVNANFTELYTELGLVNDVTLSLGAFEFAGSTLSTTDSTAIVIDQATTITSNLSVGGDIVPQTANGGDLGSLAKPFRSLYVSNNTVFLGGVPLSLDASNNLTVNGSRVGTTSYNDLTNKPTSFSSLVNGANTVSLGSDGALTLPSTSGFIDRLYSDNGGSRTKLEKKIESSPTAGTIAKLELDLDNGHIRLAIGNYTGGGDQWIDTSTWAFRGDTGSLTLPANGSISAASGYNITLGDGLRINQGGSLGNANEASWGLYGQNSDAGTYITIPGRTASENGDPLIISHNWDAAINIQGGGGTWSFGFDGNLTIPGDIRSEGNINIEINLSDSTKRIWQFGEDGVFTTSAIEVASETATIRLVDNQIGIVAAASQSPHLILKGSDTYGGDVYLYGGTRSGGSVWGGNIVLSPETNDGGTYGETFIKKSWRANSDAWKFSRDGVFSLPPGGTLRFPDATIQTTAWTGTVAASTLTGTALASGVVSSSLTSVGTLTTLAVTGAITAETFNTDQITLVGNRISTTVTNANLEIECNGTGGVVINTVAEATTASTTRSVGYLGIPASTVTTTATLTIGDAGEHIYLTTTGQTITIPAASSVAYPIGTTITFIAGPSATTTTIAIATDTLRLAGGTSTGSRTLAANGMATAVKVSGTSSAGVWYINGIGLT